jgi:hypothetical protein
MFFYDPNVFPLPIPSGLQLEAFFNDCTKLPKARYANLPQTMKPLFFQLDQGMLDGVQIFFENQFIEAQRIFATQDQVNPVYALGSGALAFMKGN